MKSMRPPSAAIFLPSATKLLRLCFYRCVSVHRGVVSQHALQQVSRGGAIPACIAGDIPACLAKGLQGVPGLRGFGGSAPRGCVPGLGDAWSGGSAPRGDLLWGGLFPGVVPGLGGLLPGGTWSRREAGIPACTTEADPPGDTATAADGTHPTGMHSCLWLIFTGPRGGVAPSPPWIRYWATQFTKIYAEWFFIYI